MAIDDKDFERWKAEAAELDPKCDYTDNYAVEVMVLACEALPQLIAEVERLREAARRVCFSVPVRVVDLEALDRLIGGDS